MYKSILASLLLLSGFSSTINAAEITTCIIDNKDSSNPVFYYYPISATKLRCDHMEKNTSATLADLYARNWRLVQVMSPVLVDEKATKAAYTPPVLYMERTEPPPEDEQQSDNADNKKGRGLFNWLEGDSQEATSN